MKCYSFSFIKQMPVALAVLCALLIMVHHVVTGVFALGVTLLLWHFSKNGNKTFYHYLSLSTGMLLFVFALGIEGNANNKDQAPELTTNASLLTKQQSAQNTAIKSCPCALFHGGEKAADQSKPRTREQKAGLSTLQGTKEVFSGKTFNTISFSAVSYPHNF